MRFFSSLTAVGSLFLTAILLPVFGGALFALFTFGAFLLSLVGVIGGSDDRSVRQHEPSMDGRSWRNG